MSRKTDDGRICRLGVRFGGRAFRLGLMGVLLVAAVAVPASPAAADDLVVTRIDDPVPDGCAPGDCSLREAVIAANADPGPDTILLPATLTLSIEGDSENGSLTDDLDILSPVTIRGAGHQVTTIRQTASDRVLHVGFDGVLLLSGVTVTGGDAGVGGGILNLGREHRGGPE